jgi:chromosome segregation ATPase
MRVDPEQLEREAEELQRQMLEELGAQPLDTTENQEPAETAPEQSSETAVDGQQAEAEEGRGDPTPPLDEQLRLAEERVKNAQSRMTKATTEAAELKRSVADLRTEVETLRSQLAQKPEDDVDLRTLAEEYPDIAAPLLKQIEALKTEVRENRNLSDEERKQETTKRHFQTIRTAHPDFDTVVSDDGFSEWLEQQTPTWRRIAEDGTADEVVELLSRFKGEAAPPQQPESTISEARKFAEPTLPRARKPDSSAGKRIWTRSDIDRLSLQDYEKFEAEIDQAMLDGRVR